MLNVLQPQARSIGRALAPNFSRVKHFFKFRNEYKVKGVKLTVY